MKTPHIEIFQRKPDIHKGDAGRVLVVGGSVGFTGAPVMAALGALRTGAGLVGVAVPETIYFIVASRLIEAMPAPLPESQGGVLGNASLEQILELSTQADVVAMGPGLGQHAETRQLVQKLVLKTKKPMVLDADALNVSATNTKIFRQMKPPKVLTPHPGEMARLMKSDVQTIQRNREKIARQAAHEFNATVVLKGHHTVVADPSGKIYVNQSGNPGMASGGMGDVLTGVIAALIGQGLSAYDAAVLGVHLHGLAGDCAAKEIGPVGFLARDAANCIPKVISKLLK